MSVSIGPLTLPTPDLSFSALDPYDVLIALLGLVLSLVVGFLLGPLRTTVRSLWDVLIASLLSGLANKLDRPTRPPADLALRGFALSLMTLAAGWGTGEFLDRLGTYWGRHFDLSIVAFSCLLTTTSVFFLLNRIRKGLEAERTASAHTAAIALLSRASNTLLTDADTFARVRATLPMCIRTFSRGLVAPIVWFLVGGLPAAFAACSLGALSGRLAERSPPSPFALMPIWIDRLIAFVPDLLAALILVLSALFTPTAGFSRAVRGLFARKGAAELSQGGRPVTVALWALNISVGGPSRRLSGEMRPASWIGPEGATAQLEPRHMRRFLYLSAVAHLIVVLGLVWVGYLR